MLNYHILKTEITRQMDANDLLFNVESLEEAEQCKEEAAAFIADFYMSDYKRGEEINAVASWIVEYANDSDYCVKIDYAVKINAHLVNWIGAKTDSELVNDLLFAFSQDEQLFELFTKRVIKKRAEYRAARETEETENV